MNDLRDIPDSVRYHLKALLSTSGMPDTEESLAELEENWLDKHRLFVDQTAALEMREVELFPSGDPRGAIFLTYSGSLLSLGPRNADKGGRWLDYASIKLRSDVPQIIKETGVSLAVDVKRGESAVFDDSSLRKTSAIFAVAVCDETVPQDEQEKRIKEAAIFLTNGFLKINHTLSLNMGRDIDQFSMRNMAAYLARLNGITAKQARQIIDDFLTVAETGVLLGERVTLGRLGKLSLKLKPAQKARVVRNPVTGTESTVPAKPETPVPRFRFSTAFKERAGASKALSPKDGE